MSRLLMDRDFLTQSRKPAVRKINGLRLDRAGEWRRFDGKRQAEPSAREMDSVGRTAISPAALKLREQITGSEATKVRKLL
jgi:hypothetical protein